MKRFSKKCATPVILRRPLEEEAISGTIENALMEATYLTLVAVATALGLGVIGWVRKK